MSRLQELIQTLCPDGIEYKRLGSLCDLSRGKVYSKPYITAHAGNYPVYSSQTANNGELGRISTYDYDGEYLTWTTDGAYAGTIFHRKGKFSITNVCGLIAVKFPEILNLRFLYYWLSIKAQEYVYRGMGNPKLMSNQMAPIEIPIPPLAVQEEIVRILDAFTSYAAELQAELQARKEQYAYYRDQLLTFDEHAEGVEWKKLGDDDVCDILTGFPFDSSKFVTQGIKLMRGMNIKRGILDFNQNIDKYWESPIGFEKYLLNENDIVVAMDGSLVGKSFGMVLKQYLPLLLVQRVARIRSTNINIRYVYFYITNHFPKYVDKVKTKGAIPHISAKDISNFPLPIPAPSEQQRIVSILDKFEALVNDLTEGLPAEIAAVQEQYEYYRNKLLSFPKITEA